MPYGSPPRRRLLWVLFGCLGCVLHRRIWCWLGRRILMRRLKRKVRFVLVRLLWLWCWRLVIRYVRTPMSVMRLLLVVLLLCGLALLISFRPIRGCGGLLRLCVMWLKWWLVPLRLSPFACGCREITFDLSRGVLRCRRIGKLRLCVFPIRCVPMWSWCRSWLRVCGLIPRRGSESPRVFGLCRLRVVDRWVMGVVVLRLRCWLVVVLRVRRLKVSRLLLLVCFRRRLGICLIRRLRLSPRCSTLRGPRLGFWLFRMVGVVCCRLYVLFVLTYWWLCVLWFRGLRSSVLWLLRCLRMTLFRGSDRVMDTVRLCTLLLGRVRGR